MAQAIAVWPGLVAVWRNCLPGEAGRGGTLLRSLIVRLCTAIFSETISTPQRQMNASVKTTACFDSIPTDCFDSTPSNSDSGCFGLKPTGVCTKNRVAFSETFTWRGCVQSKSTDGIVVRRWLHYVLLARVVVRHEVLFVWSQTIDCKAWLHTSSDFVC